MELDQIVEELPRFEEAVASMQDILLANLALLGEIPSPTFQEEQRAVMLNQRFSECGLQNCSYDEKGNCLAILPGAKGEDHILVNAHLDTVFTPDVVPNVMFQAKTATGMGLADNSLGLAVLASLPTLLEALDIQLDSNLLFMGDARSLGRGNLEGIRFFLDNNTLPLKAGICLEGAPANRLNFSSVDMFRGEITVEISEHHEWTKFGLANAIVILNEVINRILEIPIPRRPLTSIMLGEVEGGRAFNQIPAKARLRFEAKSEAPGKANEIGNIINDICLEIASKSGAAVCLEHVATRNCGGLTFNHALPRAVRKMHNTLGIETDAFPSISEVAAFFYREIPAVTIGMTNARHVNTEKETLDLAPIPKGVATLIALLLAIDGGICDED